MDAFFTIASPLPVDAPVEDVLIDRDDTGTNGTHGSCVIAPTSSPVPPATSCRALGTSIPRAPARSGAALGGGVGPKLARGALDAVRDLKEALALCLTAQVRTRPMTSFLTF
ncbi:hypothetical protein C2E23DRAFT_884630 [Lenzites betulinus]|nr:hypothetical protein C2E23DRAFT_884630 [Lenzites betulinus]